MPKRRYFLREPAVIALENLWAHKLRSFLTLLGVIIAVTALIGVISAVNGLNTYVAERVGNFGVNVFYVTRFPIITNAKDFLEAVRRNRKMTFDDYEYLRAHLTLAEEVGGQDWRLKDLRSGNEALTDVTIRGATPNIIDVATNKVASGRFFTEGEFQRRELVAFLGTDVAERFFPQVDPLGKIVTVEGIPFAVIGVAEKVGSAFGQSQDNFIYVPLTTLQKIWGQGPARDQGVWVAVKCLSPEMMEQTKDQARALMRSRRHQEWEQKDAFGIISSESVTNLWNQIFGGLASASIGIVSVFLVIGGVVIMNIMLASVTERTHEIGIRKSLGARRRDILLQFLVESSVMAGVGGLLGVLLSMGVTQLVVLATSLPMRTPIGAVVLAIGVSTAVGMFFGIWPAARAARLDPVVALRAE
ncbi:MAG TPA: ABC transporter permease [Candidatus Acidoferrales bacterium]|nr:ABC transporter permease [Candidatus Acidoferrales bacterium]